MILKDRFGKLVTLADGTPYESYFVLPGERLVPALGRVYTRTMVSALAASFWSHVKAGPIAPVDYYGQRYAAIQMARPHMLSPGQNPDWLPLDAGKGFQKPYPGDGYWLTRPVVAAKDAYKEAFESTPYGVAVSLCGFVRWPDGKWSAAFQRYYYSAA